MAATANELLQEILGVVSRIDRKLEGQPGEGPGPGPDPNRSKGEQQGIGIGAISAEINKFAGIKKRGKKSFILFSKELTEIINQLKDPKGFVRFAEGISAVSNSLPNLVTALKELEGIRERRVRRSVRIIDYLLSTFEDYGESRKRRRIENTINLFRTISRAARHIDRMFRTLGRSMLLISGSLLLFVGGLVAISAIFGVSPGQSLLVVVGLITALVGGFALMSMASPLIAEGVATARNMGLAMILMSGGLVAMALSIHLIGEILGMARGEDLELFGMKIPRMLGSIGFIIATIAGMSLIFGLMGASAGPIAAGAKAAAAMGTGMVILAGSVALFTIVAYMIEGLETPGRSLLYVGLAVAGIIGIYTLLAAAIKFIALGAAAVLLVSASLFALFGVIWFAVHTFKGITSSIEEIKESIGTDEPFKHVRTNLRDIISTLLVGTTQGLLYGLTGRDPGDKPNPRDIVRAMGSVAILMTGLGVLFSVSLTISQFAKALTAFAKLQNLRVIERYTPEGEPIFGERVDVKKVTENIVDTFGLFLNMLITETEDLTSRKARAIRRLGRSLTGRRGILSAVNDFASVLETFSKFGPEGKIGFVEMIPDGTDEDGRAKFKEVATTVSIHDIASNIANSFGTFVDELVAYESIFEITGSKGRKMRRLAETLIGSEAFRVLGLKMFSRDRPGLLEPITKFSKILSQFGKIHEGIPILDAEGNTIDHVSPKTIARNIVKTLSEFTDELGKDTILKDTEAAEKNIGVFVDLMTKTNKITESIDGLEKFTSVITNLSKGIGLLTTNLTDLDLDKFKEFTATTEKYNIRMREPEGRTVGGEAIETGVDRAVAATGAAVRRETTPSPSPSPEKPDWDRIAALIGDAVGQQVTASLRANQFKFEFSTSSPNQGILVLE